MSATTAKPGATAAARESQTVDYPMIAILATLLAVGLIEVWSASFYGYGSHYFRSQLVWVALGIGVLLVMTLVPYQLWRRLAVPLMALTLLLLIAVFLFGQKKLGATRTLGNGSIQPSEFAKLTVVIYVSAWVASKKKHLRDVKAGLVPFAVVMGVVGGLIVMQPSFSVAIITLITGTTIFFLGGGDIKQLLVTGLIAAVVLLLLIVEFHYGLTRIQEWWSALTDPNNMPYNVAQVQEIIKRGGGIGTRPENWQVKGYISLLWSDYLFANLAADTKFLGAVSVVVLFAALGYRGLSISLAAADQFGALAGVGVTTWLLSQAVIHMGTSVALIPATGIPLPFMSYGGSAMLACMAGVGLLLSISRGSPEKKAGYEIFPIRRGDGGARLPHPGGSGGAPAPGRKPKDAGASRTGSARPAAGATGRTSRKPASGPAGRWRPSTREEEFITDWRARTSSQRLGRRKPPAPKSGTTRR